MSKREIKGTPEFEDEGDDRDKPPQTSLNIGDNKENLPKIPIATAMESLSEKAKFIKVLLKEILDESERIHHNKLWLSLRSITATKLTFLFQKFGNEVSKSLTQSIIAYFYHEKFNTLIDPVDYHEVVNDIFKIQLEEKAKNNIQLMLESVKLSAHKKYLVDPGYTDFLFLVAEAIFHITCSFNFLGYQYSLTAEWCAIQLLKINNNEKFLHSLSRYKSRIAHTQEDKNTHSELDNLNNHLNALQLYFNLLKNKHTAYSELLTMPEKKPQEIKSNWLAFIEQERAKLQNQTPLSLIENQMTAEYKQGEAEKVKLANAFAQIQAETKNKISAGDNNKETKTNDLGFSDRESNLSFKTHESIENKKEAIRDSLKKIQKRLPKTSIGGFRVTTEWQQFYNALEKNLTALADIFDQHHDFYSKVCPQNFETTSIPALRIKRYEDDYIELNKNLQKYLGNLQGALNELRQFRANPTPNIKQAEEAIAKLEQEILELEQSFTKHLDELCTPVNLPSAPSNVSSIAPPPPTPATSVATNGTNGVVTPVIGIPVELPRISIPALPVLAEPPPNYWCCFFRCGNSLTAERQPLLQGQSSINNKDPEVPSWEHVEWF